MPEIPLLKPVDVVKAFEITGTVPKNRNIYNERIDQGNAKTNEGELFPHS